jgi:hypothetical protein
LFVARSVDIAMYNGNPRNWKTSGRGQAAASILPHMRANDTWQDAARCYHEQYAVDGSYQDGDYAQDYCDENESVLDDTTSSLGWNGAAQFDRCRQCCSPGSVKLKLLYSQSSGSVRFWASRIQIH